MHYYSLSFYFIFMIYFYTSYSQNVSLPVTNNVSSTTSTIATSASSTIMSTTSTTLLAVNTTTPSSLSTPSATISNNSTKNESTSPIHDSKDLSSAASSSIVRSPYQRKIPPLIVESFGLCNKSSSEFDRCVRIGLNNVRSYITTGVPELNIPSFDPIYAKEVILKRGGPSFGYKLRLKNVMETGWRFSEITKFKSNPKLGVVQITQYFPDKYLEGEYEVESMILQPSWNKGRFNLSLYELNQTTTFSKSKNAKFMKVNVDVQEIGNMKLHVSNLLRGRTRMENLLDRMINSPAWRPGFMVVRPFVNELVSTAFTDIYNKVFNHFDFNQILPP